LSAAADGWPRPLEAGMISSGFCGHGSQSGICIIARLKAMVKIQKPLVLLGVGSVFGLLLGTAAAAAPEWNPIRGHGVEIGPQAGRLIVGFKATSDNAVIKMVRRHSLSEPLKFTQAQTSQADVLSLARRTGIAMAGSRQITPSIHVVFLPQTLYGADVAAAGWMGRSADAGKPVSRSPPAGVLPAPRRRGCARPSVSRASGEHARPLPPRPRAKPTRSWS